MSRLTPGQALSKSVIPNSPLAASMIAESHHGIRSVRFQIHLPRQQVRQQQVGRLGVLPAKLREQPEGVRVDKRLLGVSVGAVIPSSRRRKCLEPADPPVEMGTLRPNSIQTDPRSGSWPVKRFLVSREKRFNPL